ncbi:MAG: glycosyltransferase, partial [Psychroserpens sp.]|nr:glycosyltransferase [Psychroserpens sp.]
GLPCMVSDADGLVENVLDQETGWVVKKRDPVLLAEKIKFVHHLETQKKQEIRSSAVGRVKQEFNLEKQNQLFLEFYQD